MRAALLPYWRLLVAGFRQQSTYRLAALGGLIANATFGLLKAAVLLAGVSAAGGSLGGYDAAAMSAYVWWSQGLFGSINLHGRTVLATRVKSGDVAIDFVRPVDVQTAALLPEIGGAIWSLLPRGVPLVLIGVLVTDMALPSAPWVWLLGALSVLLAISLAACLAYLVAVAGFWMVETRGLAILYMVLAGFLAGQFVPVDLFPDWLRVAVHATPFPSTLMTPIDVLGERVGGAAALGEVAVQAGWLLLAWGVGHLMTRAGRHRLEVQGG